MDVLAITVWGGFFPAFGQREGNIFGHLRQDLIQALSLLDLGEQPRAFCAVGQWHHLVASVIVTVR